MPFQEMKQEDGSGDRRAAQELQALERKADEKRLEAS